MIVQADDLQTGLPQVIVALVTSNMFRANHNSRVTISIDSMIGKESGLQFDSIIVTDNLATVQEKFIYRILGRLPTMVDVERALAHTFGLTLL